MSASPTPLPRPEKDLNSAKRQFVEIYGAVLVHGNRLTIAILCLSLVCLGLLILNVRTFQTFNRFKPVIIRINDIGRAEAVSYESLEYQPREAEIRYFLMQFVAKHYSRMRATVRENYAKSLYFLDGRLADATIEANKRNKTIESFLAGQGQEIEVNVKNVSIEDLRTSPFKATVDFEKAYYNSGDMVEVKRERFTAHFVFIVKDRVPNFLIPVNPLGLTITYFREDQAFE